MAKYRGDLPVIESHNHRSHLYDEIGSTTHFIFGISWSASNPPYENQVCEARRSAFQIFLLETCGQLPCAAWTPARSVVSLPRDDGEAICSFLVMGNCQELLSIVSTFGVCFFMRRFNSRRLSITRCWQVRQTNPISAPSRTTSHSNPPHGCSLRKVTLSPSCKSGSIAGL